MKKLLEYLVESILEKKPAISQSKEGELEILTVKVPKEDMGKVIGKGGKIIRAIRTLVKTRAIVEKKAVAVELEEV